MSNITTILVNDLTYQLAHLNELKEELELSLENYDKHYRMLDGTSEALARFERTRHRILRTIQQIDNFKFYQ